MHTNIDFGAGKRLPSQGIILRSALLRLWWRFDEGQDSALVVYALVELIQRIISINKYSMSKLIDKCLYY